MSEQMTWEEYCVQFPAPYDLSLWNGLNDIRGGVTYAMARKANMQWQAEYHLGGFSGREPSNEEMMTNPFYRGGWFYPGNGEAEYINSPVPQPVVDWEAEAAAGRPVIGPAV